MKLNVVIMAVLAAFAAEAKVITGTPFANNMVLQRDRSLPVWGKADPGEVVTVEFAGQKKTTTADANGAWSVALDPLSASKENRTLKVSGAANVEEIKNVLVGEVWFASGQSNMECPIWSSDPRYRDAQGKVMTSSIRRPFIRYVKNNRAWDIKPRFDWKAVWRDFSPESFKATHYYNLSATAFYYALELYGALDIPIGIIDSSWGGTCIETWTPPCEHSQDVLAKINKNPGSSHQQATCLWNGMVVAWTPFAIKGFIWYQGCSNAWQGKDYCSSMHALYNGWAKEFKNPNLKLYFVQLAPYSCSWFDVQQGQAQFAKEQKNAGMIVTCDIGNAWDIHPNDKATVGRRLALHALKKDYGFDNIVADSPVLKEWKIEGDAFVMTFDNADAWYVYNDNRALAQGFEIAGINGRFVPAKVINKVTGGGAYSGKQLIVKADGVVKPRRLRYLASKPWIGALYSYDSGLPLGPFEIDARNPAEGRRDAPSKEGDALKVPELEGFRTAFVAELPAKAPFTEKNYVVNNAASVGSFSRVAYVMELVCCDGSVDWVVAAMDAFTTDVNKLGVPSVSKATFQQKVNNLVVRSNRENIKEGSNQGSIEFFNTNYDTGMKLSDIGGSFSIYDINDTPRNGDVGYGCLQIHDWKNNSVIMAYNNFNKKSITDIGIGNCVSGEHADWTFMANAREYKARRLTIMVK